MKVTQYPRESGIGFNMTPMIDVVFLLIIFFLVSSHLAKQESRVPVELPEAVQGQESLDDESPRMVVTVKDTGEILAFGQVVSPQTLSKQIDDFRHKHDEQVEVRIRGDRRVSYRVVKPILLACAKAGVWKVTFAVYRQQG
jgi:biopolymer transport protein ExbD